MVPRIKSIKVSNFVQNRIKNLTLEFDEKASTKYSLLVTKYYVIKSSEKCYRIRKKTAQRLLISFPNFRGTSPYLFPLVPLVQYLILVRALLGKSYVVHRLELMI